MTLAKTIRSTVTHRHAAFMAEMASICRSNWSDNRAFTMLSSSAERELDWNNFCLTATSLARRFLSSRIDSYEDDGMDNGIRWMPEI